MDCEQREQDGRDVYKGSYIKAYIYTMRNKKIINRSYLRDTRKTLRKNLTPAEAAMWNLLKNKQLEDRKFRRQVSLFPVIARNEAIRML